MYSRLMHLNEFHEVGESLSNSKIVGKIFRAMMRRPRCNSMINTLEAMQGPLGEFTYEEVVHSSSMLRGEATTKRRAHTKARRNHTSSSKISIAPLFEQDII
jgi:hypothetical protein